MPQLWIETWVGQYFWLLVILFLFHVFVAQKVVPTIATLIKIRKTLGSQDELDGESFRTDKDSLKINLPSPSSQSSLKTDFDGKKVLKNWSDNLNIK